MIRVEIQFEFEGIKYNGFAHKVPGNPLQYHVFQLNNVNLDIPTPFVLYMDDDVMHYQVNPYQYHPEFGAAVAIAVQKAYDEAGIIWRS